VYISDVQSCVAVQRYITVFPQTVQVGLLLQRRTTNNQNHHDESSRAAATVVRMHSTPTMAVDDGDKANKELHIAPMMDVSYREFRYFMRLLTKRAVLWTEMVVDETLIFSDSHDDHLYFDKTCEHPIVCQLGGNHPDWAVKAVQVMEDYGYDEINLNMGCPSNRVAGKRGFGAALMKDVDLAVDMVKSMKSSVRSTPVSVKIRIGVDEEDSWEFLEDFVGRLTEEASCRQFYVHARKVHTAGLNAAQNRRIPPLNYPRVYRLCERFPDCDFYVNGGIHSLEAARELCHGTSNDDGGKEDEGGTSDHSYCSPGHAVPCALCQAPFGSCTAPPHQRAPPNLRGCMLGRAAMDDPALFGDVDRYFYGATANPCDSRRHVLLKYCTYLEEMYPRRCCDSDARVTTRLPAPTVEYKRQACRICCPVCHGSDARSDDPTAGACEMCASSEGDAIDSNVKPTPKISSRVVDRSLRPVLGLFSGLGGAKKWRRTLDQVSRDLTIRNCGPGHILRQAMATMPDALLDQEFTTKATVPP
jgi:tRNA-dihydrouridine synthase A